MAKVFRLHDGQDGTGWFVSNPITDVQLKTIKTEGKDVATSIPSPFARIDLVKSAFRWVADNGIDGNTAHHKLVSDALDVAQLLFLYNKHKDKVKIVSWNPNDRFDRLNLDENERHVKFAETLKVFWTQDGEVYNFNKVNRLYLLLNNSNQVIGGTSPASLFFSAPDVKSATKELNIVCNDDVLFDDNYCSLAKRDKSFVIYIFTLSKQPGFATYFPEVYSYLDEVKNHFDAVFRAKIANLLPDSIQQYPPCPVTDNQMNPCEVLGIPLGIQVLNGSLIEQESDFVIVPELPVNALKPLILPNDRFANQWTYTTEGVLWNPNNNIPNKNTSTPEESVLPIQGGKYNWLSIGNFLEDNIIELPYTIDSAKFKTCGSKKHILPLTPTFFKYFKSENVDKYIRFEELAGGGIDVKLELPVKKGTIIFKKTYHSDHIIKMDMHLAILPFVRSSDIELDYTLGIQDKRFDRNHELNIQCFEKSKIVSIGTQVIRKKGDRNTIKSIYCKTKAFDSIKIGSHKLSGFIVPSFYECEGNQQVSFAIDFGTTNTHIEYKHGAIAEKAIDITPDLPMWQSLIDRSAGETQGIVDDNNFEKEIFPYQFNDRSRFKFPFRTALTYNQNIRFNEPIDIFSHTNNFFLFEKEFYPRYLHLHTKLKWSNYSKPEDKLLVESYINGLMYMVLYKTLLINGNPQTTKITWFYPVSMDSFEQGIFFEVWQKSYKKIFQVDNTENIIAVPESIAPYLHYRTIYPGLSLSIDIGGGSSDIAVFKQAKDLPEFISSFKFAGNAIFGDGFPSGAFTNSSETNGFVKLYRSVVENAIDQNSNKKEILDDILNNRKDSADFSSFLFSLENDTDITFKYTDLLRQDRKIKLPILLFYGAIIYYSANLMKRQGLTEVPKNILLSGTASKTIKILDSRNGSPNISGLFNHIFKYVMGSEANPLNIALSENPKEITCKGALRVNIDKDIINCPMVFWIGGNDGSIWGKVLNKNTDISKTPYYRELTDGAKNILIENSLIDFFQLLDSYLENTNMDGNFGIDDAAYKKFKEMRSLNIQDFLEQGLKAFYRSPDKHIEESLFFYPLIGIINKLAYELANAEDQ